MGRSERAKFVRRLLHTHCSVLYNIAAVNVMSVKKMSTSDEHITYTVPLFLGTQGACRKHK
jgi:hypothetical protein